MSTEKELQTWQDALGEALPDPLRRAAEPGEAAELLLALSGGKPPAAPAALRDSLAARVAASRAASQAMHTLRWPQRAAAEQLADGLQAWPLSGSSRLLSWQAGACIALPAGTQELLLLEGELDAEGERLQALQHALLSGGQTLRALSAGRAYLRSHVNGPFATEQALQRSAAQAWQPLREGVEICPLATGGGAVSMLARFAAGASVPAHPHGVAEECLMVEGELFLGDLLLPEGGFQLAPLGSTHGALFADAPCLLFFHGAIDAQAIDNAHRAQLGWPAL